MSNETEIQKLNEMIRDYKSGRLKMNGFEFMALSEYLNSLRSNK